MAHILLIEDNESFRNSLHRTLVRAGHEVTDAPNGGVALKEYRRQPPDLVITDIVMPDKEGLETIKELRSIDPNAKIIAISGADGHYLAMARHFGAIRTMSKPFSPDEILTVLTEVISHGSDSS